MSEKKIPSFQEGPWTKGDPWGSSLEIMSHNNSCSVAVVTGDEGHPMNEATARLVAAAPDLLSALKDFREHVIRYARQWEGGAGSHHHPIWHQVALAISKAEDE